MTGIRGEEERMCSHVGGVSAMILTFMVKFPVSDTTLDRP